MRLYFEQLCGSEIDEVRYFMRLATCSLEPRLLQISVQIRSGDWMIVYAGGGPVAEFRALE